MEGRGAGGGGAGRGGLLPKKDAEEHVGNTGVARAGGR